MIIFPLSPTAVHRHFLRSHFCTPHILDLLQSPNWTLFLFPSLVLMKATILSCEYRSHWHYGSCWTPQVLWEDSAHKQVLANPNPSLDKRQWGFTWTNLHTWAHTDSPPFHSLQPQVYHGGNAESKYWRSFKSSLLEKPLLLKKHFRKINLYAFLQLHWFLHYLETK